MELSKEIKEHFRKELKEKFCFVDVEIAEPDVAPIIKPSPSKPKPEKLPEEWEIKKRPKVNPTPKG